MSLKEVYGEYLEDEFSAQEVKDQIEHQKNLKEKLGEVNLTAIQEHEALKERFTFLSEQREDMLRSIESINQAISKLNRTCRERFITTFTEVDQKLKEVFPILFNGGEAGLKLLDEARPLESGVLVEVRPPGKKLSHMGLLSGGEKALVAMALLFAIYLIKPSPFCLLDEVDAPLDEANVDRFNDLLNEIKKHSQILLVTHNRRSMEIVDSLYGVTMENAGISKMVAVNLKSQNLN
jgi:chromosome segregation protein